MLRQSATPRAWQVGACRPSRPADFIAEQGHPMRAFIFPGQGSQAVGMGAALAEREPRGARRVRRSRRGARPEPVPADARRAGRRAQAHRKCAAGDHGAFARRVPRRSGRRSGRRRQLRRRPQPRRIFGAVRGRLVRPRDDGQAAEAARPGDAAGGAGRARARWRRCSAPTSRWRRRSPTPRRKARCAPSPTTTTRRRS